MVSDLYMQQINDLQGWYKEQLSELPALRITKANYEEGIDALLEQYQQLSYTAFDLWLKERRYELSYNQICIAFFGAAVQLGLLEIV